MLCVAERALSVAALNSLQWDCQHLQSENCADKKPATTLHTSLQSMHFSTPSPTVFSSLSLVLLNVGSWRCRCWPVQNNKRFGEGMAYTQLPRTPPKPFALVEPASNRWHHLSAEASSQPLFCITPTKQRGLKKRTKDKTNRYPLRQGHLQCGLQRDH